MSANVESMFYVREKPWHGLGTMVMEAPNSKEAIKLAGLDWEVIPEPVMSIRGTKIEGYVNNVRSSDKKTLGIVSDRYKVVQNSEAFAFTDSLIGGDVRYETAGSLKGGKQIWLLAKMPAAKVAGDEVEPYLCFSNTHDGTGAVKVCMTPIRVVCNNTLNLAMREAKRSWSVVHTGNIGAKLTEARHTLELANHYMLELDKQAQMYANTTLRPGWLNEMMKEWFPVEEDDSNAKKKHVEELRQRFITAYTMPDIKQFYNTAWGVINAASDMLHFEPQRKTKDFAANNWARVMVGHPLLDMVVSSCNALL